MLRYMTDEPIKIGHHSEKRHRRDKERLWQLLGKSVTERRKAAHWEERAATAEAHDAISSDDPDCIRKLEDRIAYLESRQERMKLVNRWHAKYVKARAKDEAAAITLMEQGLESGALSSAEVSRIRSYVPDYSWNPHPHPGWELTNNSANIRRLKDRLARLRKDFIKLDAGVTEETETWGDVRIVQNVSANRTQIFFPGKPSEEARAVLKRCGFRWAKTEGCWQRHLSNGALYWAREAVKKETGMEGPTPALSTTPSDEPEQPERIVDDNGLLSADVRAYTDDFNARLRFVDGEPVLEEAAPSNPDPTPPTAEPVPPTLAHYRQAALEHPGVILLIREGDFYEAYEDHAQTIAHELNLSLMTKQLGDVTVPMAGVPFHAVERYVARLIRKGFRAALMDQVDLTPDERAPEYTPVEAACRGCMGPCGECETPEPEPDPVSVHTEEEQAAAQAAWADQDLQEENNRQEMGFTPGIYDDEEDGWD